MNAKKLLDYLFLVAAIGLAFGLFRAFQGNPAAAILAAFLTLEVAGFVAGALKLSWVHQPAPENKQLRIFSAAICVFLTAMAWVFAGRESAYFMPTQVAGLVFLVAGMALPVAVKGVETLWTPVAGGLLDGLTKLGFVLSYYTVFFFTAIVMKAMGRDPLDRKIDKAAASYWSKREPAANGASKLERYRRQF